MSTPVARDVYVDAALSQFTVKYKNANLIYPQVLPFVTVTKDTGYYFEFGTQNFRRYNTEWTEEGRANEMKWTITKTSTYTLAAHALEGKIGWKVRDAADSQVRYEYNATQMVLDALDLQEEISTAELLTTTTNYASGHYVQPATSWASDDSNPDVDAKAGREKIRSKTGMRPNVAIISASVLARLEIHPKLRAYFKYVEGGLLSIEQLKNIFKVPTILIGEAVYQDSAEGAATSTFADVWGDSFIYLYVAQAPALEQLSFGYTISRSGYPLVQRWSDPSEQRDWVRPVRKFEKKITANVAGYLLYSVLDQQ